MRTLVQPAVAHLVGRRCFSKATRRLGCVDRAWITGQKTLFLAVIFDDGETHKGHAAEFTAITTPEFTAGDVAYLNRLGITLWNPAKVLVP
jgi:hypothetical protein